ncbi:hypothetical protein F5B19DRAFT_249627 [Rostrohypoxylon terebratum]|nr:hypothetical protein F5B19DRAFT_249627 [Rostrohypoxylon terebratum]
MMMQDKGAEGTIRDPKPAPAGAAPGSASSVERGLSDYMYHATTGSRRATKRIVPHDPTPKPTLRGGRTNRIMLYNGCFNPPHRGHLAHLRHAFQHCGADFNVVAAVVLVAGDDYLKYKSGRNRNVMRLGVEERVNLWTKALEETSVRVDGHIMEDMSNWCWVVKENDWVRVVSILEADFTKDHFEVEFVHLAGGDKISVKSGCHGVWGCRTLITTDVSRPVDFYSSTGNNITALPKNLRRHTPWELVAGSLENLSDARKSEEGVVVASHNMKDPLRPVYTCRMADQYTKSTHTVRFIVAEPNERLDSGLSSTKVQAIIAGTKSLDRDCDRETRISRLADRLWGMALCPRLLASYVVEKWEEEEG